MNRFLIFFLLGAVYLAATPQAARAAECVIYRHEIVFAADSEVRMKVESGKDCRVMFPLGPKARVDKSEITTHPFYGGARLHGMSGAYYRSNPGYRGPDHFSFSFCGEGGGRTGCADVQVKVTVH
jgi:hypothetical protein